MSIINNVLKGIENKPTAFIPLETATLNTQKKHGQFHTIRWIAGLLLLVVCLLIVYFSGSQSLVTLADQAIPDGQDEVEVPAPEAVLAQSDETLKIDRRGITGLQLNETDNYLELTLSLPKGAQSFLKQSSQNRYLFLISNAGMKVLPPVIKDNFWLDHIAINETSEGVEIQFDTADGVLVETHQRQKEQAYDWVIRLKKSALESATVAPEIHQPAAEEIIKPAKTAEVAMIKKDSIVPAAVVQSKIKAEPGLNTESTKSKDSQQKIVKFEIKPIKSELSDSELLNKAQISMNEKDWLAAEKQLQKLLGSTQDKRARVSLLNLYQFQHKNSQLTRLLAKSLELYPDENDLKVIDARQLFSEKQFLTLISRYQQQVGNKEIINLLAASFQTTGQHDKAINYYQRSLTMDPQQTKIWISMAISQEQLSQFSQALQSYQMAEHSGGINKRLEDFIQQQMRKLTDRSQ